MPERYPVIGVATDVAGVIAERGERLGRQLGTWTHCVIRKKSPMTIHSRRTTLCNVHYITVYPCQLLATLYRTSFIRPHITTIRLPQSPGVRFAHFGLQ